MISTLTVGACSANPASQEAAAQPTPRIVYVTPEPTPRIVYVTPQPTVRPTAKPTPVPTPRPTPEPVLAVDEKWMEFLGHNISIAETCPLDPLTDAIANVAYDYGVDAYVEGMSIEQCAQTEVKWLNAHKPSACYKTIWTKIYGYYNELYRGLHDWNAWTYDFPYGSDSTFSKGSAHITKATSSLGAANTLLDRANSTGSFCMTTSASDSG